MSNMLKLSFDMKRDHFVGNSKAPIELVEYGDFLCEHCGEVYTAIKLLQECLRGDLKFVFRHFPLPKLHSLSMDAAVASEAAAIQGKFWEMHDLIFENQRYLVRGSFSRIAEKIELDATTFDNSIAHKKLVHKVVNDFESGVKSGIEYAPTFFINGHRYNGFQDFESLYRTCRYAMDLKSMAM